MNCGCIYENFINKLLQIFDKNVAALFQKQSLFYCLCLNLEYVGKYVDAE